MEVTFFGTVPNYFMFGVESPNSRSRKILLDVIILGPSSEDRARASTGAVHIS